MTATKDKIYYIQQGNLLIFILISSFVNNMSSVLTVNLTVVVKIIAIYEQCLYGPFIVCVQ